MATNHDNDGHKVDNDYLVAVMSWFVAVIVRGRHSTIVLFSSFVL